VDAPNPSGINEEDLTGVTVALLTCSYEGFEFVRVGYYVSNEYDDEALRENPPTPPQFDHIRRSFLEDEPRVTKFLIDWNRASGIVVAEETQPTQESCAEMTEGSESERMAVGTAEVSAQ
jgi:histone chaperone ASF1